MMILFHKELTAYFVTPFGFVFFGIFLLLSGVMFTIYNLLGGNGSMAGTFDLLKNFAPILFTVLTMRLFAEERRQGTERLLLASQLTSMDIILGKFLASLAVFLLTLLSTLFYVGIIASYGMPNWSGVAGSYLGFFLLGMAMIATCIFISSFAESQITAAIMSFGTLFLMTMLASFTKSLNIPIITPVLSAIAITTRYDDFTRGVLSLGPVVYYLCFSVCMLFLTIKNFERRRFR